MSNDGGDGKRRKRARRYRESEIDFEGILGELASVRPQLITEEDALERVLPGLIEQYRRGVTAAQIADVLRRRGLDMAEDRVRDALRGSVERESPTGEAGD